jgi:hypothetical protein
MSLIEDLTELEALENAADLKAASDALGESEEPLPWAQVKAKLDAQFGLPQPTSWEISRQPARREAVQATAHCDWSSWAMMRGLLVVWNSRANLIYIEFELAIIELFTKSMIPTWLCWFLQLHIGAKSIGDEPHWLTLLQLKRLARWAARFPRARAAQQELAMPALQPVTRLARGYAHTPLRLEFVESQRSSTHLSLSLFRRQSSWPAKNQRKVMKTIRP